ncbi:MAG: D-sedoheptulose 7-phosphate isomerase [Candidatus Omnitrophica bacterium]|nr:D-sedoheptulose 7-phosphate isomerase [Candidatus Omnitrophota bacterium]
MKIKIQNFIREHEKAISESFASDQLEGLIKIGQKIIEAIQRGRKIVLCGNGGSASDCQHIAAEFVGRFEKDRQSLPAIALTTDTSILTAVANDYGYDKVFSRQVEGLGQEGDILIALSTSGNSKNVIEAVKVARKKGMFVVGFSGESGGALGGMVDLCFCAQAKRTAIVQEVHMSALHAICGLAEETLANI